MPLIEARDRNEWDGFITSRPWSQFTQSWAWGDFRVSQGQKIQRLASVNVEGTWDAAALFVYYQKPIVGGYWYAPRGPVVHGADDAVRFMVELESKGLPGRALFWRIEPLFENSKPVVSAVEPFAIRNSQFVRSHAYMPASTLLVDVTRDDTALREAMHEKTRYNIRLAEKHGVTVRTGSSAEDVDAFIRLNEETAHRDRFRSQPSDYIRATFQFLQQRGMAGLRFAIRDGKIRAASLEVSYGDTVTYLYGASSNAERHFMAPYALHWDAIQSAKARGFRYYDFHGINPVSASSPYYKSNWDGITRFKLGWGGERRDLAGTWELPRNLFLYRLFRMAR